MVLRVGSYEEKVVNNEEPNLPLFVSDLQRNTCGFQVLMQQEPLGVLSEPSGALPQGRSV